MADSEDDTQRPPLVISLHESSEDEKSKPKRTRARRKVIYKLKNVHKDWLRGFFTTFVTKIGRRGAKGDTAKSYCTKTVTPRFMTEFHEDEDPEEESTKKTQYKADFAIYVFLSNVWKRERRKLKKLDKSDASNAHGSDSATERFHPQFYWAEANGDQISAALEKKIEDDPSLKGDVGLWRRTVSELFRAKSLEEQGKWKNQAQRKKAQQAVAAKSKEPLSDQEKMMFIKDWAKRMEVLVNQGEWCAGIQTLVHFRALDVKEVDGEEKKFIKFTSFASSKSNGYTRTKDFNDSKEKFANYVAGTSSQTPPARRIKCLDGLSVPAGSYEKKPTYRAHVAVNIVKYKGHLDHAETYDPIPYDEDSWTYFYRDTGKAGLVHWLGLPSRPKAPIPPQISSTEVETYQAWFDAIKETQQEVYDRIFSTLKLVNRLDRGVPLIAQEELWRLANEKPREVPMSIPQSPPSASTLQQWLASPWVLSYLVAPHEGSRNGSPTHFEEWQHRNRTGPLYHPLSKTYRGGILGVVWIIRGLVKHLATVGSAAGVLKLPKEAPPGSELTRLTLSDWERATSWLETWHSLLEEACRALESTVRERQKPAVSSSSTTDLPSKDNVSFDPEHESTPESEPLDSSLLTPRASIPRKAKASVSYVDPFAELDEERPEPTDSANGNSLDEENSGLLEENLLNLLKAGPVKHGNYDGRTFVSGPKPKVKAVMTYPCDPEGICVSVDDYFKSTTDLFSTYKSMRFDHGLPYTTKLLTWIREHTSSLEEPRRHLVSTILLQRLTWRQAAVVWPNAESQYREFQEEFRRGSALLVAIQEVKDREQTGPEMDDLLMREDELKARVCATRLVYDQFKYFSSLSVKYANKLRDRFLTIPLNAEYRELKQVVATIRDWRQDYSILTQDLRDYRKSVEEEYQLEDYVPHVKNSWFWYGNPSGFVLDTKAEALVKDINTSTEIGDESDEEDDKNAAKSKGKARSKAESSEPQAEASSEADSSLKPAGNQMEGSEIGQSTTNKGKSPAKQSAKPHPRPGQKPTRPKTPPPPPSPSPTLGTSATPTRSVHTPVPLSPPHSPSHLKPAASDAQSVTTPAPPASNTTPPSIDGTVALATLSSRGGARKKPKAPKFTATVELPLIKNKVDRHQSSSRNEGESSRLNQTGSTPGPGGGVDAIQPEHIPSTASRGNSKKKRRVSTESTAELKRRRADKVDNKGEEEGSGVAGEEVSGAAGRPKRTRIPSARARGVA